MNFIFSSFLILWFCRMCEPSPPALHPHAKSNVTMVGVGIKLEDDELGGRVVNRESSPVCDWSVRLPSDRDDSEKSAQHNIHSSLVWPGDFMICLWILVLFYKLKFFDIRSALTFSPCMFFIRYEVSVVRVSLTSSFLCSSGEFSQ